jgi:SAM-dependent methyltransferase
MSKDSSARPNYGIDAPKVVNNLFAIGSVCAAAGFAGALLPQPWGSIVPHLGIWPGVSLLLTGALMLYGSKYGKLRLRERLLDGIPWRGDERVLDVGCGRGLLLVGAAKRLKTGRAIGIDLWQAEDLSGNKPEATLANAAAEGVADRVEVQNGDARSLSFPDASFDVVVSSSALHNIYDAAQRRKALDEIVRVLKPGGHVAIFDIRHAAEYASVFKEKGLIDVWKSRPYFLFVIPAHIVSARKPGGT